MDDIITIENIGKKYLLSHQRKEPYTALRDVITDGFKNLGKRFARPFASHQPSRGYPGREEFWALKGVTLEIARGDRIGIIGRNGAGKSTLLKILGRITEPSEGRVRIRGRVASLLEVGTGFHPELTGRENIFLNGSILGMTKAEIKRKFDEIVAFAEVERFLDTPVKHFSSGMYVRLAFAVAAHLEPEILLIDEVLAVGDASFQKKCLGKMEDVSKSEGRTILFVSHNLTAVQNLCSKALYLHKGKIMNMGNAHDVVEHYLSDGLSIISHVWEGRHKRSEFLEVQHIKIMKQKGNSNELYINEDIQLEISLRVFREISGIAFEIFVSTIEGTIVFTSFTDTMTLKKGNTTVTCIIPKDLLNNGHYIIAIGISKNYSYFIVKIDEALTVNLLSPPEGMGWQGDWPGVVRPRVRWHVKEGTGAPVRDSGISQ